MTGTHTVNVVINGAEVLTNLLGGPLKDLVAAEINKAMSKHIDPTAKLEGKY